MSFFFQPGGTAAAGTGPTWSSSTSPSAQDYKNIAYDISTLGQNHDAAGYGYASAGFLGLLAGSLPAHTASITGATWSGGSAVITTASNAVVGQIVTITGVTPTGYNVANVSVTATGSGTITVSIASNPGSYTSGGTVTTGTSPTIGELAATSAGALVVFNGTSGGWVRIPNMPDNIPGTLASAASVTLPDPDVTFYVSGTTTITTITGSAANIWIGRQITLIAQGTVTIGGGGNIPNTFSLTANQKIILFYDGTNWY